MKSNQLRTSKVEILSITRLQPGDSEISKDGNRLNGFHILAAQFTWLKPGVNEPDWSAWFRCPNFYALVLLSLGCCITSAPFSFPRFAISFLASRWRIGNENPNAIAPITQAMPPAANVLLE